ncbi:HAD family hydrolase [Psychroserpens sp. SPM9]|uniref:HAD family hydrolase n=1 Tax=Psychroserpens sp. SPM9 TaxID=2975598 RepID=UPI0021A86EDE|nr:HAD-IA family hydrolase [Psychroserpens sp. SPM9]MDG5490615.1 HAD-IA family hydrolase [Psychroserpens sp. SPM9]
MTIKAIGFDWEGVISRIEGDNFNDSAASFLSVEKERFRSVYFKHNHIINRSSVSCQKETLKLMWKNILNELGILNQLNSFLEFLNSRPKSKIDFRMISLLKLLKEKNYKLGLLSNNSSEEALKLRKKKVDIYFDTFLISAEINMMKPDPKAFYYLAKQLNVQIHEMVFIDDSKRTISMSDLSGYLPIHFISFEDLLLKLKGYNVINHDDYTNLTSS